MARKGSANLWAATCSLCKRKIDTERESECEFLCCVQSCRLFLSTCEQSLSRFATRCKKLPVNATKGICRQRAKFCGIAQCSFSCQFHCCFCCCACYISSGKRQKQRRRQRQRPRLRLRQQPVKEPHMMMRRRRPLTGSAANPRQNKECVRTSRYRHWRT